MSVRLFTTDNAEWYQYRDREIYVGDVLDSTNSESMSVGFYRNRNKGERNDWSSPTTRRSSSRRGH